MSSRTYKPKRTTSKSAPPPEKPIRLPVIERPRHNPTVAFQDALLGEIKAIAKLFKNANIAPELVTYIEVDRLVKDALNSLYQRGLIDVGKTLNGQWIKPKDNGNIPE